MPVQNSPALTVTLPSDLEILLTREFDAPRRLVFEAMTKPEYVSQWWGCSGASMPVCDIDFRVGGSWRFVLRMAGGEQFAFHGVYQEIVPPEMVVSTECFEEPKFGNPEWLATMRLEDLGERTRMTTLVLHKSVEARNGHLQSGMESGAGQTFDRLAALLETMK